LSKDYYSRTVILSRPTGYVNKLEVSVDVEREQQDHLGLIPPEDTNKGRYIDVSSNHSVDDNKMCAMFNAEKYSLGIKNWQANFILFEKLKVCCVLYTINRLYLSFQ